jgi:nucleoside-diphosphate-sugar epimerase
VGGCGYIGGYLTDLLRDECFDTTVYDILAYEERFLKPVPFIYGDVRDRQKLRSLLEQYDTVVWLAAVVGDGACAADPFLTQAINEDSVKWLVDNYKGRIVFTSTCSVYGKNDELIDESATPNPLSVYAETKLRAEQYILEKAADRSLVFRLGTLFGLGDPFSRIRLDLVVNILAKRAACREKLRVFGGDQWRPLIHVRDVGRAIVAGLCHEGITGLYNLSAFNYRIHEIADAIQEIVPDCEVEKVKMPFEDQRNYRVSVDAWLNACPSWQCCLTVQDGIHALVDVIQSARIKNPGSPVYSNEAYIQDCYRRWL